MRALKSFCSAATVFAVLIGASACAMEERVPASDLPNFHQVDPNVYRGGQPTEEGFKALGKIGIHTVIDLRPDGEDGTHSVANEAKMAQAAGMQYINVPLSGTFAPSHQTVAKLLHIMTDPGDDPVFVHCHRGADRTGTIVASYRMAHDHWTNADALREAGALGMSWHEFGMRYFVASFRAGTH